MHNTKRMTPPPSFSQIFAELQAERSMSPLVARRVKDFRWVASSEFEQYPFPDADQKTMDQLLGFSR